MAARTRKVDLALTPEQEQELRKYVRLAYWLAGGYYNYYQDTLLEVDDLAQIALIGITKAIKCTNTGYSSSARLSYYRQHARWACLCAIVAIKNRHKLAQFISINHIRSEDYDAYVEYTPDYDRQELLDYALEYINSLPIRDKTLLQYVFGVEGKPILKGKEFYTVFKDLNIMQFKAIKHRLIKGLRNAPKIKEILECQQT